MKLLNNLISTVKYWKDYFQSDVSLIVDDLCEYLRYCPQAFEVTQEGGDLYIGLRDSRMWRHLPARIRLGFGEMTLDMAANSHAPINVREYKKLGAALDTWLDDREQLA